MLEFFFPSITWIDKLIAVLPSIMAAAIGAFAVLTAAKLSRDASRSLQRQNLAQFLYGLYHAERKEVLSIVASIISAIPNARTQTEIERTVFLSQLRALSARMLTLGEINPALGQLIAEPPENNRETLASWSTKFLLATQKQFTEIEVERRANVALTFDRGS
jgi:hypothetical protein